MKLILLLLFSIAVNDLNAATVLVSEAGETGGNCTLREAVDWINTPATQPAGCNSTGLGFGINDQIDFAVATVTLSIGQLEIDKDLTINGGVNGVTIEGGGSSRILNLDASQTDIILNNLILSGGSATEGAAIYMSNASLFINGSRISGNHASSSGGAIFAQNYSHISIDQSEISNNTAQNGGAIYAKSNSSINLTESSITNNDANFSTYNGKGGGFYLDLISSLTVEKSTISNNTAGQDGGGIVASNNSVIVFNNSALSSNKALAGGGISMLSNVEVTFNSSIIAFNEVRSTPASNGGGGTGGGLDIYTSTVTLNNSTISNNLAQYSGGGIRVNGGTLVLNNSTLASNINRSFNGGLQVAYGSVVTLNNSIVADSKTEQGAEAVDCRATGNPSTVNADDHNIVMLDNCGTDALNVDPQLAPLAYNDGLTRNHGLYVGSPAVDNADDVICADAETINNLDQRDMIRPEGMHCDIGSFEGTVLRPSSFYVIPTKNGKTVVIEL